MGRGSMWQTLEQLALAKNYIEQCERGVSQSQLDWQQICNSVNEVNEIDRRRPETCRTYFNKMKKDINRFEQAYLALEKDYAKTIEWYETTFYRPWKFYDVWKLYRLNPHWPSVSHTPGTSRKRKRTPILAIEIEKENHLLVQSNPIEAYDPFSFLQPSSSDSWKDLDF